MPSRETRAVFLDLSKAFDRVWHSGLLYKLECNGICGSLLGIIHDFLHERKQRVASLVMLDRRVFWPLQKNSNLSRYYLASS